MSVPDGWKLVPIEPTREMLDAMFGGELNEGGVKTYRSLWLDVMTAIPEPPSDVTSDAKPVCYIRMLNGKPDWAEDCVSEDDHSLRSTYDRNYSAAEGYSVIPLYARADVHADCGVASPQQIGASVEAKHGDGECPHEWVEWTERDSETFQATSGRSCTLCGLERVDSLNARGHGRCIVAETGQDLRCAPGDCPTPDECQPGGPSVEPPATPEIARDPYWEARGAYSPRKPGGRGQLYHCDKCGHTFKYAGANNHECKPGGSGNG